MAHISGTHYFLGSNSPTGFRSLYPQFMDAENDNILYILKGGPGCGKSTFMKQIAQTMIDAGYAVEFIHCSGDPDSLDGVLIPALKIAYVDGTAPHGTVPLKNRRYFFADGTIPYIG
jgi:predicted AAA+ superfamily ATPase